MYEMTDAGMNAIPIENTKAAKNPETMFSPAISSLVLTKGRIVTLISRVVSWVAVFRIALFIALSKNIGPSLKTEFTNIVYW